MWNLSQFSAYGFRHACWQRAEGSDKRKGKEEEGEGWGGREGKVKKDERKYRERVRRKEGMEEREKKEMGVSE